MTQTWTHRPTWPKVPETYETDRIAVLDGVTIGRVRLEDRGPRRGVWLWSSAWSGHATGETGSREEALKELREAYEAEIEQNSMLLEQLRQKQSRSRTYLNNWLRSNGRNDEVE